MSEELNLLTTEATAEDVANCIVRVSKKREGNNYNPVTERNLFDNPEELKKAKNWLLHVICSVGGIKSMLEDMPGKHFIPPKNPPAFVDEVYAHLLKLSEEDVENQRRNASLTTLG